MNQDVADKIRELAYLMEHATPEDAHKEPEMRQWFEDYFARASPQEVDAVRAEVRKLWPRCAVILMQQAESRNPELAARAKRALERMGSLRQGGKN